MKKDFIIAIVIFLVVITAHFNGILCSTGDTRWYLPVAISIIRHGDINLDEYADTADMKLPLWSYSHFIKNNHIYNDYPIGTSVVALPFVLVLDNMASRMFKIDLEDYLRVDSAGIEVFIASFIVALTAVFIYYLSRMYLGCFMSAFLTFIFAFCTSSWSMASRSLYQHGPVMLFLVISLYLILLGKKNFLFIQLAGVVLAFSFLIRPTNLIPLLIFSGYVFCKYRKYFLSYIIWPTIILGIFLFLNLSIYHMVFPTYYWPNRVVAKSNYFQGLVGTLFSPGRGLYVFTPILLFSVFGIIIKIRKRVFNDLDFSILSIVILHWLAMSITMIWWGGHCFGPRFFTDMLPYHIYFLIPAAKYILESKAQRKLFLGSLFLLLAFFSFFVHCRGAVSCQPHRWSSEPTNIDEDRKRLWDWSDLQFFRGLFPK